MRAKARRRNVTSGNAGNEGMTMNPSVNRLRSVFVRGTGAAVVSSVALAACSRRETGSALAGMNAVSHWLWGDADARRNGFSWKYTVIGALTQEAAAVFWAFCFEYLFASRHRPATASSVVGEAAAISALACAVDYTITPKRFTPGYELRLSKSSLAAVYAAFAAGLALGSLLLPKNER
jgi:hypothetical protein